MREIIWFCLVCWFLGGFLIVSAVLNWRITRLPYLSSFFWGRIVSRVFTCGFGLVLVLVGFMVFFAK